MSYINILKPQLVIDEDKRSKPYRCTAGKLSIGVGRNLEDVGLSDDEIELLLSNDIKRAEAAARRLVPAFEQLSDARKAVVVNMAFNLGETRLRAFVGTLAAINRQDWAAAASGMRNSLWFKQVGNRAVRLVAAMERG